MSLDFSPISHWAGLPKLSPQGDNYQAWANAWLIAFRWEGLLKILTGKELRPADPILAEDWDERNNKCQVMLMGAVHVDHTPTITTAPHAAIAWAKLRSDFDRDREEFNVGILRNLINFRYHDSEDLRVYLARFHQAWDRMRQRCSASSQSSEMAMRVMFESDEIKGLFLLITLPETMNYMVNNLSICGSSKYEEIGPKLLGLVDKHSIIPTDTSTFVGTRGSIEPPISPGLVEPRSARPCRSSSLKKSQKNYVWCYEKGFLSSGHNLSNCNKLKASKRVDPSSTGAPVTRKEKDHHYDAQVANTPGSDSNTTTNVCMATTNGNGKRPLQLRIFSFPIELNGLPNVYPSATGSSLISCRPVNLPTSRYMSGNLNKFSTLSQQQGIITIDDEHAIPVDGKGTVEIPSIHLDGSTKTTVIADVLYSRMFHQTLLFRWPFRWKTGCILQSLGGKLHFIRPNGQSFLWAQFRNGLLEIQDCKYTPKAP